jgi:hypothetical protein
MIANSALPLVPPLLLIPGVILSCACGLLIWCATRGEVSERLKEPASKAGVGETRPWVQIPPSPPPSLAKGFLRPNSPTKARIWPEIRAVRDQIGLRRISFLVIPPNKVEISPAWGPEVRFRLPWSAGGLDYKVDEVKSYTRRYMPSENRGVYKCGKIAQQIRC